MPTINEKGMWRNKEGDFIHPDMITPDKQLEDETVESIVKGALVLQKQMIEFKAKAFEECYGFVDLLRQKYNMERITSKSGTVTLKNFDGTKIVEIQVSKLISFDQKLSLAKEKIDEYLTLKTNGADAEIQTLITRVFDVKNGKVDAKQILSLKSYPIEHELWKEAMSMIDDATEIAGTKSYIRFKHRKNGEVDGSLEHIVLDLAGLEMPIKEIEDGKA
ncbi:DUF3164 family protein [Aliarcobacter butzleri]|uniref:DUF3164 family protein n=1 Tax=Aliarcobacter butzleri TaxID=28197 RepID=UPI001EDB1B36|nr:DUF3164 family protein [Aliarcobacter butzleri]MCG3665465.1 DUF3164 family protein [Aliarcobacter butzleri]